jgi:hypothetical protein
MNSDKSMMKSVGVVRMERVASSAWTSGQAGGRLRRAHARWVGARLRPLRLQLLNHAFCLISFSSVFIGGQSAFPRTRTTAA